MVPLCLVTCSQIAVVMFINAWARCSSCYFAIQKMCVDKNSFTTIPSQTGKCTYLSELFCNPHHRHNTRNSDNSINLPLQKSVFGHCAFSFTGASIWCPLPTAAQEASMHARPLFKLGKQLVENIRAWLIFLLSIYPIQIFIQFNIHSTVCHCSLS